MVIEAKATKRVPWADSCSEITKAQRRTLKEIRLFTNRRGFPPTMEEPADILGISHAGVNGQVS